MTQKKQKEEQMDKLEEDWKRLAIVGFENLLAKQFCCL